MIEQIVRVTPVVHHVPVREKRERRQIALPEPEGTTDDSASTDPDGEASDDEGSATLL